MIEGLYNFQIDKNTIPVFYVNKNTWTDEYKNIIHLCLSERRCYVIVEPDPNICNRYVEYSLICRVDFYECYEQIDHLLGLKIKNHNIEYQ